MTQAPDVTEAAPEPELAYLAACCRDQGTQLWQLRRKLCDADELAHEVYRFLYGIEPRDLRKRWLIRALARYREPMKETQEP